MIDLSYLKPSCQDCGQSERTTSYMHNGKPRFVCARCELWHYWRITFLATMRELREQVSE